METLLFFVLLLGRHPSLVIPHSGGIGVHCKLGKQSKKSLLFQLETEWNGEIGDFENSELSLLEEGKKKLQVCLVLQQFRIWTAKNVDHLNESCGELHVSWFPASSSRRPTVWSHWGMCWCWDPQHAQMITWGTRQGFMGTVPISSSLFMLVASSGHAKISRCLADYWDSQKSCRLRKQLQSPKCGSVSKAENSWLGSVSYVRQIRQLQTMYSTAKLFFPLSRASYWTSHALSLDIVVFAPCFLREQSNHLINMQLRTAGSITIHAQGSALSTEGRRTNFLGSVWKLASSKSTQQSFHTSFICQSEFAICCISAVPLLASEA